MEWSDWSSCVSVCVEGAALDCGSVQVRSRAVLAQEPENLQLCPDQQWESRPCTGQVRSSSCPGSHINDEAKGNGVFFRGEMLQLQMVEGVKLQQPFDVVSALRWRQGHR